jgi:hypothetical protein
MFVETSFRADAEFIAHAREDIPWLLEQIDQLQSAAAGAKVEAEDIAERSKEA